MTDEARIKLAEAVFHGHISIGGKLREDFDPFTDANDDYAVLEWMRNDESSPMMPVVAMKLGEIARDRGNINALHNYKIGDYARAACKVLDIALEAA